MICCFNSFCIFNFNVSNESGFTALPGCYRNPNGSFTNIGSLSTWGSSTEVSEDAGYVYFINNDCSFLGREYGGKMVGASIRCLKDVDE